MNIELFREWLRPYTVELRRLELMGDADGAALLPFFHAPFFAPLRHFKIPDRYWEGIRLRDGTTVHGATSLENVSWMIEFMEGTRNIPALDVYAGSAAATPLTNAVGMGGE